MNPPEQQHVLRKNFLDMPTRGTGCSEHHSGGLGTPPAPADPAEGRCRARTVFVGGSCPSLDSPLLARGGSAETPLPHYFDTPPEIEREHEQCVSTSDIRF